MRLIILRSNSLELVYFPLIDILLLIELILEIFASRLGLLPLFAYLIRVLGHVYELRQQTLRVEHILSSNQHLVRLHLYLSRLVCIAFLVDYYELVIERRKNVCKKNETNKNSDSRIKQLINLKRKRLSCVSKSLLFRYYIKRKIKVTKSTSSMFYHDS